MLALIRKANFCRFDLFFVFSKLFYKNLVDIFLKMKKLQNYKNDRFFIEKY